MSLIERRLPERAYVVMSDDDERTVSGVWTGDPDDAPPVEDGWIEVEYVRADLLTGAVEALEQISEAAKISDPIHREYPLIKRMAGIADAWLSSHGGQ